MTLEELRSSLENCEDVTEADVNAFFTSTDENARLNARAALAKTRIRQALAACVELARDQQFADQGTLSAIDRLAGICDVDEAYIEALKQLGIIAARNGKFDGAMTYLQTVMNRAVAAGQRRDPRSRRSMHYIYDAEIAQALEQLAYGISSPPAARDDATGPMELTVLCSAIQDEDGPSIVTVKRAQYFRDSGFKVTVVSTEMASSGASRMLAQLTSTGIPFVPVPAGTWTQRRNWLVQYFSERPADAIVYEASGVDNLAKLCACIGLAPVQAWDNKGVEPQCGRFDIVAQSLSAEAEIKTRWPGKSRFYGMAIALADEIDQARPFTHAELNLPEDAIVLATFGRVEKCVTPVYLRSLAQILIDVPQAWLLLAGPDNFGYLAQIERHFRESGVGTRVRYLGRRQADAARLSKSIDLYCDTFPWPGGQSMMDAMQAGRAIVAMKRPDDCDLDATGVGISAVADVMLDGVVELASPGSAEDYVRIAMRFISDPVLRKEAGERARSKAVTECSMRIATERFAADIRQKVLERGSLASSR